MQFDPMTGEPIEEQQNEENMQFDPMTGEPIGQAAQEEQPIGGFDPMTGEPIGQAAKEEQPTGGFDPMTGEPIGQAAQEEQPTGGFDPMTGEPIGQTTQQAGGFDPMTGAPVTQKPKSKVPVVVGAVAGVVVLVVLLVFGGIKSGLFLGKSGKVLLAANNTLKKMPHFVETLEPMLGLVEDEFTVEFSAKAEGVKIGGSFINASKQKQVTAKLEYGGESIEGLAGVDSNSLKFQVPDLSKKLFVYNYKKENSGYIVDLIGDEYIDTLNSSLEQLVSGSKDTDKAQKDVTNVVMKELKSLKFQSAAKEEFTVNDKDVMCKGYTTTITGANIWNIIDGSYQAMLDNYQSVGEAVDVFSYGDIESELSYLENKLDNMEDVVVTFYIYKNQLAAIVVEDDDFEDDLQLCFEGGDYRLQNITFKSGSYRISMKGSDDGTKEKFKLREKYGTDAYDIGSFEYNYESGKYKIEVDGEVLSGKLYKEGRTLNLSIDGQYDIPDMDFAVTRGAKLQKFSGDEFDIGNADADDLYDLVDDITDELSDFDYLIDLFKKNGRLCMGGKYLYFPLIYEEKRI